MNWVDVSDAVLMAWRKQGDSYGTIMRKGGAPSRDAVAGRIKRLLARLLRDGRMDEAEMLTNPPPIAGSPAPQRALPARQEVIADAMPNPVSIFALRSTHCRYPLWEDVSLPIAEKMYCGAVAGPSSAYCDPHRALCCTAFKVRGFVATRTDGGFRS